MNNQVLLLAVLLPPFVAAVGLGLLTVLAVRGANSGAQPATSGRVRQIGAVLSAAALLFSAAAAARGLIDLAALPAIGADGHPVIRTDFGVWFAVDALSARARFVLDPLACTLVFATTAIAFAISLTEFGRTDGDPKRLGTFAWLNLAAGCAVVTILAGNLPLLLAGWIAGGLATWALTARTNGGAGLRVFALDRIGDGLFLVGAVSLLFQHGSLDLPDLARADTSGASFVTWICLVAGIAVKLGAWPLDPRGPAVARCGPSGTAAILPLTSMVIGVYVAVRLAAVLAAPGQWSSAALGTLGAVSAVAGFLFALTARDGRDAITHILAASGGVALFAVAVGAGSDAVTLALVVAFSGSALILAEDMLATRFAKNRRAGAATIGLVAGAATLASLPLTSGHLVSSSILTTAFAATGEGGAAGWLRGAGIVVIAALFVGAVACTRLVWSAFRADGAIRPRPGGTEPTALALAPALALAAAGLCMGLLNLPATLGPGEPRQLTRFLGLPAGDALSGVPASSVWAWTIVIGAIAVSGVAVFHFAFARRREQFAARLRRASVLGRGHAALLGRGYLPGVYERHVARNVRRSSGVASIVDDFVIDAFLTRGVFGILARVTGEGLRLLQSGRVQGYALAAIAGSVIVLLFFLADALFGGLFGGPSVGLTNGGR